MADKKQSRGIGVCGTLTIIFIVLKCLHIINWKWIWVLSPTWLPTVVIIIIGFIYIELHGGNDGQEESNNED